MKRTLRICSAFLAALMSSSGCKEETPESSSVKFTSEPEGGEGKFTSSNPIEFPSVKFTSEPRKASLIIDGKLMGKTPIDVPLDPKDLIRGIIIQTSIEDYHPAHFKLTASSTFLGISALPGDSGETHTKCHNGELQNVHLVLKNSGVPSIPNPSTANSSITAAPQN